MKKLTIPDNVTRAFGKAMLNCKKHSPEILVISGIVGVISGAVLACKATTKLGAILQEREDDLNTIADYAETNGFSDKYTEKDAKKDELIVNKDAIVDIVKLYAPAAIIGVLSITSILASTNILKKRNVALAAAYSVVDKGYKEYRSRVVERFGEEVDKELKNNIKVKQFEETTVDGKGQEKTIKKDVPVSVMADGSEHQHSDYARFYDEGCTAWTKSPETNLLFLKCQQNYANDKLRRTGVVYLNEVYKMLGIPLTKAGQVVGWVYDEKHPKGDNFIDFGIYQLNKTANRDFVNGYERSILLDFNVDGYILDDVKYADDTSLFE